MGKPGKCSKSFGIYASILYGRESSFTILLFFQHPLMPPYGTPVPYPALYPPGSIYAHPSMAVVSLFFTL